MAEFKEPKLIEKRWDKEIEIPITKQWEKEEAFNFDKNTAKPIYSIDTPPPYVNSPIHIGHATVYSLMDMFARYKRSKGYEVLFPLGLDRNGLPIEIAAEKKFNIRLLSLPREKALEYCKTALEESSQTSVDSFSKLGISFSSYKIGNEIGQGYNTDSDDYRKLTQSTFIDLFNKGLIYEDERINNWDSALQTTIADSEIEYKDVESEFCDVKFKCKETGEDLIIGTTRPELIGAVAMVIYNPEDERYTHLEGKTAITPIYGKEVPIKAHPHAKTDKGTGLVMMASAGDVYDIQFFRELSLKPIILINTSGRMNELSGPLNGLKVKEARDKIKELLEQNGLLIARKKMVHRVPISERSKAEIEFISMKEYYLKQMDYAKEVLKVSNNMKFFSEESRSILEDWIKSVNIDWPLSRRRYYGTEIPVWRCLDCGELNVPPKGKYYQPWKEASPIDKCKKCSSKNLAGEDKIFDTWFDSASTPMYILGYARDDKFFNKNPICSVRPQGKEIVRTWLYYTLLKSYLLTGKEAFKDAWIHYHVVDKDGYKMSKSKGNGIDPNEILNKFGAESFRLWIVNEGNIDSTDLRCSFDRIEGAAKTITKLWNASRFISSFDYDPKAKYELMDADKWIISEIDKLVLSTDKCYSEYDFHNPSLLLKHFLWDTFSSHYLEIVKRRAYGESLEFTKEQTAGAIFTLNYVLQRLLQLLSPVIPIITYKIYNDLYGQNIHKTAYPSTMNISSEYSEADIEQYNAFIWKYKKDNNISLKDGIKSVTVPAKYKSLEKDMVGLHSIGKIEYGDDFKI